jgi:hypothetical protein
MSMVHISYGMKDPGSPYQRSECAILAGVAQATLPDSKTPWQEYVDNYDLIHDTMAKVLEGFESHIPGLNQYADLILSGQ